MSSSNLSLYENDLCFYFVSDDETKCTEEMQFGRKKLRENIRETNIKTIAHAECLDFASKVRKQDIFIFEAFEGETFQRMCQTNALILGPRCLISCLMDGLSVPNVSKTICTMAMNGLIICLSSLTSAEKNLYEKLVKYMGGRTLPQFTDHVTHLVTNSVMSKKYEQAALCNVPIMKPEWITEVWNLSRQENILATSSHFDKYRVPIFYNLGITTTGLSAKTRNEIQKVVEKHGAIYHGGFQANKINILILQNSQTKSDKLKAAFLSKKECLTPAWITDSVQKGFAVSVEPYRVSIPIGLIPSTPEKSVVGTMNMSQDMSCVVGVQQVNETALSNASSISSLSVARPVAMATTTAASTLVAADLKQSYKSAFEKLNLNEAKKAGPFLDGCNIFICGFSTEEINKIVKILNSGGATRFETVNANVSHVIIGAPMKKDLELLNAKKTDAVFVTLDWLIESISQKQAIADCSPFRYKLNSAKANDQETADAPSPASKKNILSMTGNFKVPKPKRLDFKATTDNEPENSAKNKSVFNVHSDESDNENLENMLLDQYMNAEHQKEKRHSGEQAQSPPAPVRFEKDPNTSHCSDSDNQYTYEESEVLNFFNGISVHIHGFDEESREHLIKESKAAGANVILDPNYSGTVDYLIVAMDAGQLDDISVKARNVVNQNWLILSKRHNKLEDIPYYFEPIIFPEELKPLGNMIIVFSLYTGDERLFLQQLAEILGAEVQDSFKRANKPLLISPSPDNAKYEAAIKWGLPVVNREWLLECYRRKIRIPFKNYLVGDSIQPVDDIDEPDMITEDEILQVEQPDEEEQEKQLDGLADTRKLPNQNVDRVLQEENIVTPKNRRLAELMGDDLPSTSPRTKKFRAEVDESLLNVLDTPERDIVRGVFANIPPDSPNTRRLRRAGLLKTTTPETPECMKTPFREKQKAAYWDERRKNKEQADEEYNKAHKPSTPWTEHKRKFWKNALGDQYESPSQCYDANTQPFKLVDPDARRRTFEQHLAEEEADENIRRLNDFINNRAANAPDDEVQMDILPETVPPMTDFEIPNTQPNERVGWCEPSDISLITPKKNINTMKYAGTPVFSISCSTEEMKVSSLEAIRKLGGKICENIVNYDKSCTHLVCEKPNRGEKTFSCIAGGKWVLGLGYIQASVEAGHFINEELYEWGNPKAINLPKLTPSENEIISAIHRCRSILQPDPRKIQAAGIFKDFRVILRVNKFESLKNLIEAGGGKVVNIKEPYNAQNLKNVTHVIGQSQLKPLSAEDRAALRKANVICVEFKFLSSCITSPTWPDPAQFALK